MDIRLYTRKFINFEKKSNYLYYVSVCYYLKKRELKAPFNCTTKYNDNGALECFLISLRHIRHSLLLY